MLPKLVLADHLMLTRDAARLLQVSRRRVRQFGDEGRLRYEIVIDNIRAYHKHDVQRLAATRAISDDPRIRKNGGGPLDGRLVAEVFECFRREMTLPEIVEQLRYPPELIRRLFDEYSTPLRAGERPPPVPKGYATPVARREVPLPNTRQAAKPPAAPNAPKARTMRPAEGAARPPEQEEGYRFFDRARVLAGE